MSSDLRLPQLVWVPPAEASTCSTWTLVLRPWLQGSGLLNTTASAALLITDQFLVLSLSQSLEEFLSYITSDFAILILPLRA